MSSSSKKRQKNIGNRNKLASEKEFGSIDEKKDYFCVTCKNKFGTSDLAYHTAEKCKPKTYKQEIDCRICSKTLNNRESYEIHWDKDHKDIHRKEMFENGIRCRMCPRYFINRNGYTIHLKHSHSRQIDKFGLNPESLWSNLCSKCGFLASDQKMMKEHMDLIHEKPVDSKTTKFIEEIEKPNNRYKFSRRRTKCRRCPKSFSDIRIYEQHWLLCHKSVDRQEMFENAIKCNFCDRWFPSVAGYGVHLGLRHLGQVRDFAASVSDFCVNMCRKCGHRAMDKLSLQKHVDEVHQGAKPKKKKRKKIKCRLCPKSFYPLLYYERHWKQCHPLTPAEDIYEKPITCYICKTQFLSIFNYKQHVVQDHSDQLNSIGLCREKYARCYLCRKCGIFTESDASLKTHAKDFHGIPSSTIDAVIESTIQNIVEESSLPLSAIHHMLRQGTNDLHLNEVKTEISTDS